MPRLLACLADLGRARTEAEQSFEFGVLIAIGGVDVDVQPGFRPRRLIAVAQE